MATRSQLVALALLLAVYSFGLGNVGLIGPDEPRYAAVGRHMAGSGDYITPHLWGEPWFEKPPLLYWLVALGFKTGLAGEWAVRMPVVLMSAGFIVLYFFRMRREFGPPAAAYSTGILSTSAGWLAYTHVAVTDVLLASAFCGCVLLSLPWVRSGGRRGLSVAGVLLGVAVLAKGFVPLVLALPIFWFARRDWRGLGAFVLCTFAVAAPWYIACYFQNGAVFVEEFIYKHHVGRFLSPDLQHVQPIWFYVPVLLGLLFPWTPAMVALAVKPAASDARHRLLVAITVIGFVFFSISKNKLPGYVLPLIPLLAALMGIRVAEMRSARWIFAASAMLLALIPFVAAALPFILLSGARDPVGWTQAVSVPWVAALVVLGVAACWLEAKSRRALGAALLCSAVAGSVLAMKSSTFRVVDEIATARPMWNRMKQQGGPIPCVQEVPREIREGLNFYAGRALPDCQGTRQ